MPGFVDPMRVLERERRVSSRSWGYPVLQIPLSEVEAAWAATASSECIVIVP